MHDCDIVVGPLACRYGAAGSASPCSASSNDMNTFSRVTRCVCHTEKSVRAGELASQMATEFRAYLFRIVLVVVVLEGIVTEVVLVGREQYL